MWRSTPSTGWWRPPSMRFAPGWVLVSAGFDAHRADPLAELAWSAGDYALLTTRVLELAPGPGRTVAFLEGGYDLDALRASSAATVATLAGVPHATGGADEWRSRARRDRADRARARGLTQRSSSATTSSSLVGRKSTYHWPMARNGSGVATHTTASATSPSSTTVDRGATGVATTTRRAPARARHEDRGPRGAPGGEPVIHQDRGVPGQGHARTTRRATAAPVDRARRCSRAATASSCPSVMRSASSTS